MPRKRLVAWSDTWPSWQRWEEHCEKCVAGRIQDGRGAAPSPIRWAQEVWGWLVSSLVAHGQTCSAQCRSPLPGRLVLLPALLLSRAGEYKGLLASEKVYEESRFRSFCMRWALFAIPRRYPSYPGSTQATLSRDVTIYWPYVVLPVVGKLPNIFLQ